MNATSNRFLSTLAAPRRSQFPCCVWLVLIAAIAAGGCGLVPDVRHNPSLHNPFPQLHRVAILPFYNQSNEPTVDGVAVAEAYYAGLQAIPGFEVLPVGVTETFLNRYSQVYGEPQSGADFQRLAQQLGVEAIVVGSVTDFSAYYPPRMALTTHWYAANPGFHPIPAGYGLPWGSKAERHIPRRIKQEAEFALAREQLATQTPRATPSPLSDPLPAPFPDAVPDNRGTDRPQTPPPPSPTLRLSSYQESVATDPEHAWAGGNDLHSGELSLASGADLPADWPSPLGFIPDGPQPVPPEMIPQTEPVLSHTRLYRGDDLYFTERLSNYVENGDDARTGGWQNYLRRSNDFIRFCCHLHISEMLESRGGVGQSDLIIRWPISRY